MNTDLEERQREISSPDQFHVAIDPASQGLPIANTLLSTCLSTKTFPLVSSIHYLYSNLGVYDVSKLSITGNMERFCPGCRHIDAH